MEPIQAIQVSKMDTTATDLQNSSINPAIYHLELMEQPLKVADI